VHTKAGRLGWCQGDGGGAKADVYALHTNDVQHLSLVACRRGHSKPASQTRPISNPALTFRAPEERITSACSVSESMQQLSTARIHWAISSDLLRCDGDTVEAGSARYCCAVKHMSHVFKPIGPACAWSVGDLRAPRQSESHPRRSLDLFSPAADPPSPGCFAPVAAACLCQHSAAAAAGRLPASCPTCPPLPPHLPHRRLSVQLFVQGLITIREDTAVRRREASAP